MTAIRIGVIGAEGMIITEGFHMGRDALAVGLATEYSIETGGPVEIDAVM